MAHFEEDKKSNRLLYLFYFSIIRNCLSVSALMRKQKNCEKGRFWRFFIGLFLKLECKLSTLSKLMHVDPDPTSEYGSSTLNIYESIRICMHNPACIVSVHPLYRLLPWRHLSANSKINRDRIFKRLWSPGIDSKEWIPPAYLAWRASTITLFLLGS